MKNLLLFILTIALFGCSGSKDDKMPTEAEILNIKADLKLLEELSYFKENVQIGNIENSLYMFDAMTASSVAIGEHAKIIDKKGLASLKASSFHSSIGYNYNKALKLIDKILKEAGAEKNVIIEDEKFWPYYIIDTKSLSKYLFLSKKLNAAQSEFYAQKLKTIIHDFRDTCNFLINDMYNGNFDSFNSFNIKEIKYKTDTLMNYGLDESLSYKCRPHDMHNSIRNNYKILSIPSYTYIKGENKDYITHQFENISLSNAILLISFYSNRLLELENVLLSEYIDYIQNETFKLSIKYEDPIAKP